LATKALFLYTELAPYVLACLKALVEQQDVELHLVRWPVNKEAPFELDFPGRFKVYDRDALDDESLVRLVQALKPEITFASGWVDKGYMAACRELRKRARPTVMCSDTAWRGDVRQVAAAIAARFWVKGTFSHAWVTGGAQATYAAKLGFPETDVRTGFYSADVDRFSPLAHQFAGPKAEKFPHRFLCVARYIPTKGHQYLCDAFAELCAAGEAGDWELWIAGMGELYDEVRNSPSGRHDRIKHLGFIQADAMPDVLARCGVFVLPSTYEPWGVVVQEHACAGFPLLLSDAVGAAERFLVDGVNGGRFIAGDKASLKDALGTMIGRTDEQLRTMGEQSAELGNRWNPTGWAQTAMSFLQ
jgi:glycosyltransferase involved in cell wall biosynthesis